MVDPDAKGGNGRGDSRPGNMIYVDDRAYGPMQSITNFNPGRLLEPYNGAEPYIGHVFIQRPTLALGVGDKDNYERIKTLSDFQIYVNDPVGNAIIKSLTRDGLPFLPYAHARAKSYPVQNAETRVVEKIGTYYGHSIHYGRFSEQHKKGGNVSINFANDRGQTMLKMAEIWRLYIKYITRTMVLKPNPSHIRECILDYPSAIYYFVTKRDGKELVYWEKLYGTFPTVSPLSNYEMSSGSQMIMAEDVSLDFEYSIKSEPNDYEVLIDFNHASKAPVSNFELLNTVNEHIDHATVDLPVIYTDPKRPGKYMLGWYTTHEPSQLASENKSGKKTDTPTIKTSSTNSTFTPQRI